MAKAIFKAARQRVFEDVKMTHRAHENIDLTYITPSIVAMSFPASGYECAFRNDIEDVAEMLKRKHSGHYCIWNLSERSYDYQKFDSMVRETGWPDHHAPPLLLLLQIMLSLESWTEADFENIVVIHCMAGKGRTGLVVACQLFYLGICSTMKGALKMFADKRSQKSKGVGQLGQLRYANYIEKALRSPTLLPRRKLTLTSITLKHAPSFEQYYSSTSGTYVLGCCPCIEIYSYVPPSNESKRWSSSDTNDKLGYQFKLIYSDCLSGSKPQRNFTLLEDKHTLKVNVELDGDVLIKVLHVKERAMFSASRTEMFHFQFHTMFIDPVTNSLSLGKAALNTANTSSKFRPAFSCTAQFKPAQSSLEPSKQSVIRTRSAPHNVSGDVDVPSSDIVDSSVTDKRSSQLIDALVLEDQTESTKPSSTMTASASSSTSAVVSDAKVSLPRVQITSSDASDTSLTTSSTGQLASQFEPLERGLSPRRVETRSNRQLSPQRIDESVTAANDPLLQTLALVRHRWRARRRARAAANAAATGNDNPLRALSTDDLEMRADRHKKRLLAQSMPNGELSDEIKEVSLSFTEDELAMAENAVPLSTSQENQAYDDDDDNDNDDADADDDVVRKTRPRRARIVAPPSHLTSLVKGPAEKSGKSVATVKITSTTTTTTTTTTALPDLPPKTDDVIDDVLAQLDAAQPTTDAVRAIGQSCDSAADDEESERLGLTFVTNANVAAATMAGLNALKQQEERGTVEGDDEPTLFDSSTSVTEAAAPNAELSVSFVNLETDSDASTRVVVDTN